jgi:hypothetical protein
MNPNKKDFSLIKWITRQPSGSLLLSDLITKTQHVSEDPYFSILEPCRVTMDSFELYDGVYTYRFDTLREAKKYAEELKNQRLLKKD